MNNLKEKYINKFIASLIIISYAFLLIYGIAHFALEHYESSSNDLLYLGINVVMAYIQTIIFYGAHLYSKYIKELPKE